MTKLKRAAFAILPLMAIPALAVGIVTLSDYKYYGAGVWSAFVAPFGAGKLVSGVGYTESIVLNPATFPAETISTWNFPATPSSTGVYAFNQLSYGDSNGGPHSTPSVQIKNLNTLTTTHNLSIDGGENNYDVMYDGFLTSTAYGANIHEISIFVHTPAFVTSYVTSIPQIGSFTGSGVTWTVAQAAPGGQIVFMPASQADELFATIDMKAMFAYLVSKGVLTGNEYFNGIALGVEPYENGGSLIYNSWSMIQN